MSADEASAPVEVLAAEPGDFDETLFKASIRVTLLSCFRFKDDKGSDAGEGSVGGPDDAMLQFCNCKDRFR